MKNLILFSLLVSLYGCSVSEKLLYNTWSVTEAKFRESETKISSAMQDTLAQKLKETMTITFKPDHTYSYNVMGVAKNGTWNFDGSSRTITTQTENKKSEAKIYAVSEKSMDIGFNTPDGLSIKLKMAPKAK